MFDQEKILSFLRFTGPVLPAQVAKHINSNILLASAHLSELSSQGKIKISHLKIGGSPLYYLSEHREKLQNFLHNLNPKDQETLALLKERKVLKEHHLDLLTRVSLRNIKDFALPLNITFHQTKELFWKWYLLSDQQALEIIKEQFSPPPETPAPSPLINIPEPTPPPPAESPVTSSSSLLPSPEPLLPFLKEETKELPVSAETKGAEQQTLMEKPKKPLLQKIKEKLKPKRKEAVNNFLFSIESFFQERRLKMESKEILRKNSEINFIVEVTSVVGQLKYFCKAKNKKSCDEKDLAAAYMEAQAKKLPLLFLYTNELSKKAQEMLDSGVFENVAAKRIE